MAATSSLISVPDDRVFDDFALMTVPSRPISGHHMAEDAPEQLARLLIDFVESEGAHAAALVDLAVAAHSQGHNAVTSDDGKAPCA